MGDEELDYRFPSISGSAGQTISRDEVDFSTLQEVEKILHKAVQGIDSVHVFDLEEKELSIKEQIAAYRAAGDIVEPIHQMVKSAIEKVQLTQEERE